MLRQDHCLSGKLCHIFYQSDILSGKKPGICKFNTIEWYRLSAKIVDSWEERIMHVLHQEDSFNAPLCQITNFVTIQCLESNIFLTSSWYMSGELLSCPSRWWDEVACALWNTKALHSLYRNCVAQGVLKSYLWLTGAMFNFTKTLQSSRMMRLPDCSHCRFGFPIWSADNLRANYKCSMQILSRDISMSIERRRWAWLRKAVRYGKCTKWDLGGCIEKVGYLYWAWCLSQGTNVEERTTPQAGLRAR